ncbi:MAG: cation:proton antiporter [Thaumarchaeota archaeon]|nr:cation:proton antiporter [Nitrososphaerota archaeon]
MAIQAYQLIQDLAVIMIVSGLMAILFHKLKQPLIIGYLLAGIILGPSTWPGAIILDLPVVNSLAQVGVAMLLFVVGLEFPADRLEGTLRKVLTMASFKVAGTFVVALAVTTFLSFTLFDSLFIALAITVTSTVVASKFLSEMELIDHEASALIISVSIVEDVIVLSFLAILQSVVSVGTLEPFDLAWSLGLALFFIIGTLVLGSRVVPRAINLVGDYRNDELLILVMLAIAFGLSIVATVIGISVATGAFLAGVLVARSSYHETLKILATPLRDMFAALFFVSMGALMDVTLIPVFIIPAVILSLISISMKLFTVLSSARAVKYGSSVSLRTAFGLSASGGEVGLVVAKGGADVQPASTALLPLIGVVTLITTFLSAFVVKAGWRAFSLVPEPAPPRGAAKTETGSENQDEVTG